MKMLICQRKGQGWKAALIALIAALTISCSGNIERTITSGSYDGFVIGSTGEEVYQRVQEKHENGEVDFFSMSSFFGECEVSELEGRGDLWRTWRVHTRWNENTRVSLYYENGIVERINDGSSHEWNPMTSETDRVVFHIGMSHDSAQKSMERLILDTLFSGTTVVVHDKDFERPYDPIMLDSSKYFQMSPSLKGDIMWGIVYPGNYFENSIELYFREQKLFKIKRYRIKTGVP